MKRARQWLRLPGVKAVEIKMDANVPADGRVRGLLQLPIRNAIAIGSGKGGVGKSTVAVNTAVVLAQSGARVGLLDADIYGPNIPTMMGIHRLPGQNGEKLLPAEAYGVKVMSIGFLVKPNQPLIWRGPMLHSAIRQFLTDVEWGELDYLVVDLPPGTGDAALSLAQSLPLSGGVIVTLPQQVSLEDARRGLEMFRALDVPLLGVVENMSYLELPDGTRMDIFGNGWRRKARSGCWCSLHWSRFQSIHRADRRRWRTARGDQQSRPRWLRKRCMPLRMIWLPRSAFLLCECGTNAIPIKMIGIRSYPETYGC